MGKPSPFLKPDKPKQQGHSTPGLILVCQEVPRLALEPSRFIRYFRKGKNRKLLPETLDLLNRNEIKSMRTLRSSATMLRQTSGKQTHSGVPGNSKKKTGERPRKRRGVLMR